MSQRKIAVRKAISPEDLAKAFEIRYEVFVLGQQVPQALEEENNNNSTHFLATIDGEPAGAARWRKTENGYKLERFAVLDQFRNLGIAKAMVETVLVDIPDDGLPVYLNSQIQAVGLYQKFNFVTEGPEFEEAGIRHYKMVLQR